MCFHICLINLFQFACSKFLQCFSNGIFCAEIHFDIRSFHLNFEVNAFIYDGKEVAKLEHIFEKDMEVSEELTWEKYCQRSLWIKFKESMSRLLSDLL